MKKVIEEIIKPVLEDYLKDIVEDILVKVEDEPDSIKDKVVDIKDDKAEEEVIPVHKVVKEEPD